MLEEEEDNPVVQELQAAFARLNVDEQLDLLALTWLGRGDFSSFADARKEAEGLEEVHAGRYLIGTPNSATISKRASPSSAFRWRTSRSTGSSCPTLTSRADLDLVDHVIDAEHVPGVPFGGVRASRGRCR